MAIKSRICDTFGIKYPIFLAGMGGAANPALAAAVSNAGGLGVLGAAACTPEQMRRWIKETRELTDKPFGVDTLLPMSVRGGGNIKQNQGQDPADLIAEYKKMAMQFMTEQGLKIVEEDREATAIESVGLFTKEFFEAQMEVVIEEKVPVYAAGLGNPDPWMERMRANNTKVMTVVGAVRHTVKVAAANVDAIVAQGHDAGGHNSPIGTMALLPQVVDAANGIPVLGAGGISDGRGIAAALMLGAEGVWIGSAFLAAEESGIHPHQKQAIVDSTEEGTVISRSITGKPARIIRSAWTDFWERSDHDPLPMPYQSAIAGKVLAAADIDGRQDINPGFAGQGIGMIKKVRPAAEIMAELVEGLERTLQDSKKLT
tara:strand:- start:67 stop:1182 length:1116 start_codon:yes stop_codon:yes gene_type:complete